MCVLHVACHNPQASTRLREAESQKATLTRELASAREQGESAAREAQTAGAEAGAASEAAHAAHARVVQLEAEVARGAVQLVEAEKQVRGHAGAEGGAGAWNNDGVACCTSIGVGYCTL